MIKPSSDPTFATNGNFAGGPDTGALTRLDPSAPMRADGMYRDRRLPNRVFNAIVGEHGDWIKYLSDIQIRNWLKHDVDFFASTYVNYGATWIPESTAAAHDAFWCVFGSNAAGSVAAFAYPSAAVAGHSAFGTPTLTTWTGLTSNGDGSVLVSFGTFSGADTIVRVSTDRSVSWTSRTVKVGTNLPVLSCVWDTVHSLFVLVLGTTFANSPIYTSPDGVTWTNRVSPTGATGGSSPVALLTGNGQVLVLSSAAQLSIATNGGTGWGAMVTTPVAFGLGCFDAAHGWTFAAGSTIYTSASLAAFTSAYTFAGSLSALASDGQGMTAATVAYTAAQGVLYSVDGWATNRFVPFDVGAGGANFRYARVLKHNGLSQWGLVSTPSAGTLGASTAWAFHTSLSL